jgi:hypothetical protein
MPLKYSFRSLRSERKSSYFPDLHGKGLVCSVSFPFLSESLSSLLQRSAPPDWKAVNKEGELERWATKQSDSHFYSKVSIILG